MAKIKFEGIVGNNCGIVEKYTGSEPRLKKKGTIVSGGIRTLRGFAKISDLAEASQKDPAYQRPVDETHVKNISEFLEKGKVAAKFLPEVVLVSRNNLTVNKYVPKTGTNKTVIGEVENLDYCSIEVEKESLIRIDGNHRLEAGAERSNYVPFSIILWEVSDNNVDNEAFLFHFLNGKAKKLLPEENYIGLVKSIDWSDAELFEVNPILPLLRQFHKITQEQLFCADCYIHPLAQMAEILEIMDLKDILDFSKSIKEMNEMLPNMKELAPYLSINFNRLLPQLIFYALIVEKTKEDAQLILKRIDKWAEKYRYKKDSFVRADKLFNIAKQQLDVEEIWIFVAMKYYSKNIVEQFNTSIGGVVNKIVASNPNLKLYMNPIMKYMAPQNPIDQDIFNKITECKIFVADISEANPNVFYELGYAKSLGKYIILLKKKDDTTKIPFDIITKYHNEYDPAAIITLEKMVEDGIKDILINEMGIPLLV